MEIGRKNMKFYRKEQNGGRHVTSDMCDRLDIMQQSYTYLPSLK